jgi:DNA invertase Pin-like site-specific DNA recombinase
LSREDDPNRAGSDKLVSNSIQNQTDLIRDYVKNCPDIEIVEEISDDGWSGVSLERPGFQRAMDLIRAGKADCFVCKDLTRFSRNFTEAGKYLEHVLPFLGCRFIAVNDGIDSSKPKNAGDNIVIPFKNLVADAYLRDISVKIRSQFEIKRKKGDFIGSFVSFGYIKDDRDHNKIVVDEYAAEIVRMIFKWRIDGLSQLKIADKLNELGVLSPLEYKRSVGLNFKTTFKSGVTAKWSASAVKRIITNEIYIGNLVQGKTATPNHKIKKNFRKPEADWVRVEGNHDAVISAREFALANELSVRDTRVSPSQKEVYLFSGMLRCGQCGENMIRQSVPRCNKTHHYYVCCNRCAGKRVSEIALTNKVTEELQKQISSVIDLEQLMNYIDKLPLKQDEIQKTDKILNAKTAEIERLSNLKLSLYETMVDGLIDEGSTKS